MRSLAGVYIQVQLVTVQIEHHCQNEQEFVAINKNEKVNANVNKLETQTNLF